MTFQAQAPAPDIGAVIFAHTSDSHFIELPFGLGEWHLPDPQAGTGWNLFFADGLHYSADATGRHVARVG